MAIKAGNKVGRPRTGEYRTCADCVCRICVRKGDIDSITAGQRCRSCQRRHTSTSIREAKEMKQSSAAKTTECGICGYFGNEKLDGQKVQCPKCGMGILKPFKPNNVGISDYETCGHRQT